MLSFSPDEEDPPESDSAAVPYWQSGEVHREGATGMYVSRGYQWEKGFRLILLFVSLHISISATSVLHCKK